MEVVNKFFLNYFTLNKDISNGYIELKCFACGEIKDEEEFKEVLEHVLSILERCVQIVTLNDLENYKEYSTYTLINNEVDFISKVVNM